MPSRRRGADGSGMRVRSAVAALVAAASATELTSAPAWSWGSLNSPPYINTHRCIGEYAYNFLQLDPAFDAAAFPTVDGVDANEGISLPVTSPVDYSLAWLDGYERHAYGPGPNSAGSTFDSCHYYNPCTGKGTGPAPLASFSSSSPNGRTPPNRRHGRHIFSPTWPCRTTSTGCSPPLTPRRSTRRVRASNKGSSGSNALGWYAKQSTHNLHRYQCDRFCCYGNDR